jgi:hypothetical protein
LSASPVEVSLHEGEGDGEGEAEREGVGIGVKDTSGFGVTVCCPGAGAATPGKADCGERTDLLQPAALNTIKNKHEHFEIFMLSSPNEAGC